MANEMSDIGSGIAVKSGELKRLSVQGRAIACGDK